MGRVSQAQAEQNRERIVESAARLFRERGAAGVSVADVTAEAGLTHGGFYKHFPSKEALLAEAVERAFAQQVERLAADDGPRDAYIARYLSPRHRDSPGDGCPTAGFGPDLARAEPGAPARDAFAAGVAAYAHLLGDDLATVSTLVGAIVLARATAGTELSEEILRTARERVLGPARPQDPAVPADHGERCTGEAEVACERSRCSPRSSEGTTTVP